MMIENRFILQQKIESDNRVGRERKKRGEGGNCSEGKGKEYIQDK